MDGDIVHMFFSIFFLCIRSWVCELFYYFQPNLAGKGENGGGGEIPPMMIG